ncbi:virulence RhuM family protein [Mesorhizobium sp. M0768]
MAELFGVSLKTISEHLQNLFKSGELSEETVLRKSRITAADGKAYLTSLYDLNAIIAVGYKVNSKKAAEFRKWSATVLKGYIQDGYALNGKRLNSDPRAKLAREVRAIRTSETNLTPRFARHSRSALQTTIRMIRRRGLSSQPARTVFISRLLSRQLSKLSCQEPTRPSQNMGLTALGNRKPTAADVTIAKNYCSPDELRKMELIGEAWLLYAEGMAIQGKQVSMLRLLEKLKELVAQYEFPVSLSWLQKWRSTSARRRQVREDAT